MQTEWAEWLAAERAAGRGGRVLAEWPITRGKRYELILRLPGNVTGSFAAGLYAGVAADLAAAVTFTAVLGAYDAGSGTTDLSLTLAASSTDTELPPDSNLNGLSEAVFKLDWTPPGGVADRALGLVIPIIE